MPKRTSGYTTTPQEMLHKAHSDGAPSVCCAHKLDHDRLCLHNVAPSPACPRTRARTTTRARIYAKRLHACRCLLRATRGRSVSPKHARSSPRRAPLPNRDTDKRHTLRRLISAYGRQLANKRMSDRLRGYHSPLRAIRRSFYSKQRTLSATPRRAKTAKSRHRPKTHTSPPHPRAWTTLG